MNKKIYHISMLITISVCFFFIMTTYMGKKERNGKVLKPEMAESIWLEIEYLSDIEKSGGQDIQEPEENSIPNSETLKWGDVPQKNVYESYSDFTFLEMEFADDKEFEYLQEIYRTIPFYGGFPLGDSEKYEICKDKFAQMLRNEITMIVSETGEECYLEEFEGVIDRYEDQPYDLERYCFYLFDIDGNDAPELCLFNVQSTLSMCIFKYDFNLDKIVLWKRFSHEYFYLFGTNSFAAVNGNVDYFDFYQVDENVEPVFRTAFAWEGFHTNGIVVYMIVLPQYIDSAKRDPRIEQMEEKAFYDKGTGRYYLRVTEEQYGELFEYYLYAEKKASEELKKLKKNYWELFG